MVDDKISSFAVECANGWTGALSGGGEGVREDIVWSPSLSDPEGECGICIFNSDLRAPWGVGGSRERVGNPAAEARQLMR